MAIDVALLGRGDANSPAEVTERRYTMTAGRRRRFTGADRGARCRAEKY